MAFVCLPFRVDEECEKFEIEAKQVFSKEFFCTCEYVTFLEIFKSLVLASSYNTSLEEFVFPVPHQALHLSLCL